MQFGCISTHTNGENAGKTLINYTMATVNFRLQGKSNPTPIYVRFRNGNKIDIEAKTGLFIQPKFWDQAKQRVRNVIDVPNRMEINEKLANLDVFLFTQYNSDYSAGTIFNKSWLEDLISKFFNRPKMEVKLKNEGKNIYLSDYAQYWINEKAPTHKVAADRYMDKTTIGHYQQVIDNIKTFEGNKKILLKNITSEIMDSFSSFLTKTEGYSSITAERKISRLKFFCERAEEDNLEVNKNYQMKVFVSKEKTKYKHPYLSEDEISRIYKYDFSYNATLDNVRDNLIIGLWTGLRVSDFLKRLHISNFEDGFIEIVPEKTEGYDINVSIPVHWMVKEILQKRKGKLPPKISEPKFNNYIKDIGQIVEIDNEMIGGIVMVDEKTKKKRKVIGLYKKYLLITSHICRRSFATNLFGKVPNKVIMDVAGWKSERQMLDYIKKTNRESALVLKEYWEKKFN